MTYWVETDIEDPWLGVAKVCIPPRPSDVEDPSLGVTDGGIIWRGLSSQGSLVDVDREVNIIIEDERVLVILVVGHPGPFVKEEADLLELKRHVLICTMSWQLWLTCTHRSPMLVRVRIWKLEPASWFLTLQLLFNFFYFPLSAHFSLTDSWLEFNWRIYRPALPCTNFGIIIYSNCAEGRINLLMRAKTLFCLSDTNISFSTATFTVILVD